MVNNSETNKNTTYQIIVNKASDEGDAKAVTNQAMNKAKKIRSIGIGILAIIVVGIIIFFIVQHKKNKNNELNDYEDDYEDDFEDEIDDDEKEEHLNLDNETELFKRVNKSQFKTIQNKEEDNEKNVPETKKIETEKSEVIENYFRSLENKRKGKHF